MSITMQGNWTVTVKSKNAAFAQRFVVSRPGSPDIIVDGAAGNSVFVNAPQWAINVQSRASSSAPWIDSKQRITFPTTSGGLVHFDINTDDTGGDLDYNDLVLTCSMPVASSEFVVYGNAKTYSGPCIFNPCFRFYLAIETPWALRRAMEVPDLRKIIEKLYPERIPRRPWPDPGPLFTPMLLPKAGPQLTQGMVFRSAGTRAPAPAGQIQNEKDVRKFQEAAVGKLRGRAVLASFDGAPISAGSSLLTQNDIFSIAKISDRSRLRFYCDDEPAPGLLLRFQEYDRTDLEKAGGAYTGTGTRENLGLAATDELGNYIFRFSRTPADFADEALDVAPGEDLATQFYPDVIVQALGSSLDVEFETAPYYNIPNLLRIDLCMPYGSVHPSNPNCTAVDRIITKIGDIVVLNSAIHGSPNNLTTDGIITCRNVNAPQVDCAAWRGSLRLYACMTAPNVARYTIRYSLDNVNWQFVQEGFSLINVPMLGTSGYTGTPVGPTPASVHLDGAAVAVTAPTYDNHGNDSQWIENDLKVILNTSRYRDADHAGTVYFRIQGYDAAGNLVAGVDDTIPLFIANKPTAGSIHAIDLGTPAEDDCTLLTLPAGDPNAPISVKYTVDNPDGFLESWGLSATRGNNVSFGVTPSGGVVPASYPAPHPPGPADPCQFHGTADYPEDADGNTVTQLVPTTGNWLPDGKTFCAFAFTLTASDRVTDGRVAYPQTVFWQDLVGINL